jgi:hypothetical protein
LQPQITLQLEGHTINQLEIRLHSRNLFVRVAGLNLAAGVRQVMQTTIKNEKSKLL